MNPLFQAGMALVERGAMPAAITRWGVRSALRGQLRRLGTDDGETQQEHVRGLIKTLNTSEIAIHTQDANEQHYELPTDFFLQVLGPRLKYSSCYWPEGVDDLPAAEEAMLALTGERAQLGDGMDILELGCGWGSLTLWMAEHFTNSHITAVSNSRTQREFILQCASARNLTNVEVITADVNAFHTDQRFDRVVSVEMFEHMRNYACLMERIAGWLKPGGKLFVHIFAHRETGYLMNVSDNWMARYFFAGGTLPADDLLLYFQRDLVIADHWRMNGGHYARTLNTWLEIFDRKAEALRPLFAQTYGAAHAGRWMVRWRLFFLVCAELMALNGGNEYMVSHYLFEKR